MPSTSHTAPRARAYYGAAAEHATMVHVVTSGGDDLFLRRILPPLPPPVPGESESVARIKRPRLRYCLFVYRGTDPGPDEGARIRLDLLSYSLGMGWITRYLSNPTECQVAMTDTVRLGQTAGLIRDEYGATLYATAPESVTSRRPVRI